MKNFIFLLLLIMSTTAFAQGEVVSNTQEFIVGTDTTYIKNVLITSTNITGVNDTSITYTVVPDTATAIRQIYVTSYNELQREASLWSKAFEAKRFLQLANERDTYLENLTGVGYYDRLRESMEGFYTGRWRIVLDTLDIRVDIVPHPTIPDLFRATEVDGAGAWNIRAYASDRLFAFLNFQGAPRALVRNEVLAPGRIVFQSVGAILPTFLGGLPNNEIVTAVYLGETPE